MKNTQKNPFVTLWNTHIKTLTQTQKNDILKSIKILRSLNCGTTTTWDEFKIDYDDENNAMLDFQMLVAVNFCEQVEDVEKLLGTPIQFPSGYSPSGIPENQWIGYLVNEATMITADRLKKYGIDAITLI